MGAKRSIVKENKNGRQNSQNAEKRSRKRKNPKAVRQLTAIYVALVLVAAARSVEGYSGRCIRRG